MKEREFDLRLMEDAALLPPGEADANSCTPWQEAIAKIILGMFLSFFHLSFWYLNYLLPLFGSVLVYLGYRAFRTVNPHFRRCWRISAFLLGWHVLSLILSATPLLALLESPPLYYTLAAVSTSLQVVLMLSLRGGIRLAFTRPDGAHPRDWMLRAVLLYLLCAAIVLWGELVPGYEPGFMGITITNELLYYGRPLVLIVLYIRMLMDLFRQQEALTGFGYDIVPSPVRLGGKPFTLAVFAVTLLGLIPALLLSNRLPMPEAETVTAPLAGSQTAARDRLIALGMSEEAAWSLDEDELELCSGAQWVRAGSWADLEQENALGHLEGNTVVDVLSGCETELSGWAVGLQDGTMRCYYFFRYRETPALGMQEQFSVESTPNYHSRDYAARLLWEEEGATRTAVPQVQLAGGETAGELDDFSLWWYEEELDRLGHLHYDPWFSFSIPRGAEQLRGYLALTIETGSGEEFYDATIAFLRHQNRWFNFPFQSIDALGGATQARQAGPFYSTYARFYFPYS